MKEYQDLLPGVPIILADGLFPTHPTALSYIDRASVRICCDGSTLKLLKYGLVPDHIVGDMDTLEESYQQQFQNIIIQTSEQETNDLTKAVNYAMSLGLKEVVILGATGNREDHTLGNMGLLVEHGHKLKLQMISDYGNFSPIYQSTKFPARIGQQISIFSIINTPAIKSNGLKYPLNELSLSNWWMGTLNETTTDSFSLQFEKGGLLVFRQF